MRTRHDRRCDGRTQRAGLRRARHLHRPTRHVCVNLHRQCALVRDAAAVHYRRNLHAVFLKPVDDGQCAKRRSLDESAVNFRRRRVKRLADEQTGEFLIHENRAIAIVPIQRDQSGFARLQFQRRLVQITVRQNFFPARFDVIHQPVEQIAHGGLAGFESEISRQHASVHDAAKSRHIGQFFCVRRNRDVAGARANDFHQRSRRHTRTDRAEMRVECTDRDRNSSRQTSFLRPCGGESADRFINRKNARRQTRTQFRELRI